MLNNLPLIVVMILSLFLAFYCVDSHKEKILATVNIDEKNITNQEVESAEKVYVEVLAVEDANKTNKILDEIVKGSVVVENSQVSEKVKEIEKVEEKTLSEYSEGYKLDELEKMIMDELKKGNKD